MNRDELVGLFTELGAADPEVLANSQVDEGIPQLHRFVFLRQAWQGLLDPGNSTWIENLRRDPSIQGALLRILAAGADPADLGYVIRTMQQDLLFSFCYQLDDPGGIEPGFDGVSWGLFVTDADGNPSQPLTMLHESVIQTDPLSAKQDRP